MKRRWDQDIGKTQADANVTRVTIEVKTVAANPNSLGNPVRAWNTYLTNVSCAIFTPTGHKLEIARQLVPTATHQIEMQYRALDPNVHRVNYKGTIYAIGHVNDVDKMHRKIILTCTEEGTRS